ncbi:[LysW]-aminoadipate kinase [Nocardioides pantholopis]|uniref:[LysW]-aminoadipate kinase n=1 Tax=Nocardioides pantholopis TaxID=2483798 RepID=UPI000F0803D5|nr:[LysW]-aminoadipate kinase [Nocardioides pantholopis]
MKLVIKCGGHGDVDFDQVALDVAAHVAAGDTVTLVHGGSAAIDAIGARLGIPGRRLHAPDGTETRYTDAETLRSVRLALLGEVKPQLVVSLHKAHVRALSMSALDAGLVRARRKGTVRAVVDGRRVVVRDNLAGRIEQVEADVLAGIHDLGLVPVLSPPALTVEGEVVNVDADRLAANVASATDADRLILLTSAPGLLSDPSDPSSCLSRLDAEALDGRGAIDGVLARGGMRMKLIAAGEAIAGGVPRVHISDGRRPRPVQAALQGAGTVIECREGYAGPGIRNGLPGVAGSSRGAPGTRSAS